MEGLVGPASPAVEARELLANIGIVRHLVEHRFEMLLCVAELIRISAREADENSRAQVCG